MSERRLRPFVLSSQSHRHEHDVFAFLRIQSLQLEPDKLMEAGIHYHVRHQVPISALRIEGGLVLACQEHEADIRVLESAGLFAGLTPYGQLVFHYPILGYTEVSNPGQKLSAQFKDFHFPLSIDDLVLPQHE